MFILAGDMVLPSPPTPAQLTDSLKKTRYFYHKIIRLACHHFAYLSNYSLVATFKETMSENHYKPGCRHTWGLGNQLFLFGSEAGNFVFVCVLSS